MKTLLLAPQKNLVTETPVARRFQLIRKFNPMKNQWLIKSGFLIPITFWTTTLICGFLIPGYNHATRMVSELGEIGTKTQYLFTFGLVLTSIFSVFFNIGLYRICRKIGFNVIPILILWTFSFSIFGAGVFSFPQRLHGLLGSPSIVLFLSPLTALIFWKTNLISNIKVISLLTFIFMLLGFFIFVPSILPDNFGIKQRFFHIGWTVWFLCLAFIFSGINKRIESRAENHI
jgi:hypothetical membrane protein